MMNAFCTSVKFLAVSCGKEGILARRAKITAESARRCIARRGPIDDHTETLASDDRTLGWTICHSGVARAPVCAPGQVPPNCASALPETALLGGASPSCVPRLVERKAPGRTVGVRECSRFCAETPKTAENTLISVPPRTGPARQGVRPDGPPARRAWLRP